MQSLEATLQQDFNHDGTTGLKTTTIETAGATDLVQVANEFFLRDGAGSGPSLKYAGADVVAGQFGAWTPLGAEKVGTGYQMVWQNGSADQYVIWNTRQQRHLEEPVRPSLRFQSRREGNGVRSPSGPESRHYHRLGWQKP